MRIFTPNRLIKRMAAPFRHQVAILLYHRVCEVDSDYWSLCVSPLHFAEQLDVLRSSCEILRLSDLVEGIEKRRLPKRGVVITFDDGYVDNLRHANPLLDASGIPATVFVVSGCLESAVPFWWDELEAVLLQTGPRPPLLRLKIRGDTEAWPTANPEERREAYAAIHKRLAPMSVAERGDVMDELCAWAGVDLALHPDCRPMTADECMELGRSGLIDIGAHSVTHPFLPSLSATEQEEEIVGSREALARLVGRRVDAFSYPSGKLDEDTVRMVKAAGYRAGVMAHGGTIGSGANPFRLERVSVCDWDAEEFEKRLDQRFRS